jgi:hypothetical protein
MNERILAVLCALDANAIILIRALAEGADSMVLACPYCGTKKAFSLEERGPRCCGYLLLPEDVSYVDLQVVDLNRSALVEARQQGDTKVVLQCPRCELFTYRKIAEVRDGHANCSKCQHAFFFGIATQ